MEVVKLQKKLIKGISIRTTNADEMNTETAKIGKLHQDFDQNVTVDYKNGARVYGVYYNYDSDASGEFSVLSGADHIQETKIELETITLPSGKYMLFQGQGDMPQAVIKAWGEIWAYFSNENSDEKRAYTSDFEHYISENEVNIYIAIL